MGNMAKTEHYMEMLEQETTVVKNIYQEILNAGGAPMHRDKILDMSLKDFIYICNRNHIDFNVKHKKPRKVANVEIWITKSSD